MNRTSVLASIVGLGMILGACACSQEEAAPRTAITAGDSSGAPVAGMAHGNHNPKYGGVVLMNGNLHFEVVTAEDGRCEVYFSDEARRELPASVISALKLGIRRPGFRAEPVDMKISSDGAYWEGKGGFVGEKDADLDISFMYQGEERKSDMPYFAAEQQKQRAQHP